MPMFSPVKIGELETATLVPILDSAYKALKDAEPARQYLGASMLGADCARSVAYQYHGTPKDPGRGFTGRTYRIFDMGHDGETRMAQYLRLAGFDLRTERADGSQYGFVDVNGRFRGHIDGVLIGGPSIEGVGFIYPALWENKALGADSYKSVVNEGIRRSKPLYYGQVQIYMAYMGLDVCLFTCISRDTGEVYVEVIRFDALRAQELSDRAAQILASRDPEEFPRIARDETDFRCRFCDYPGTCWRDAKAMLINTPAPSWLGGA